MHIPSSMLHGTVCPVTLAVGGLGVAAAGYAARQSPDRPAPARFAAVTSLIFALQMMNFPVQNGTSGHLVGAVLGVALLGVPFAVLAMTIVLAVQAVFFGDGGLNALGANVINMALLGAGVTGILLKGMNARRMNDSLSLISAAWLSVMAGASACSLETAWSHAGPLNKILPAMLSVHALIGIGEGVLTLVIVRALEKATRLLPLFDRSLAAASMGLAFLAAVFSPMASSYPDGLEWVADKLSFITFQNFEFPALFPDYQVSLIGNTVLATIAAGIIGVSIVYTCTFAAGMLYRPKHV